MAPRMDDEALNAVVRRTCVMWPQRSPRHRQASPLQQYDILRGQRRSRDLELMIGKLRLDMMPPAGGVPRPGGRHPRVAGPDPRGEDGPGRRRGPQPGESLPQRLNQVEVLARSVQDLLGVEVDPSAVPAPGDHQRQLRQHLRRAELLTSAAGGGGTCGPPGVRGRGRRWVIPLATPCRSPYGVPQTTNQRDRSPRRPVWLPVGGSWRSTDFPADGEYSFRLEFHAETRGTSSGGMPGGEQDRSSLWTGSGLVVQPIDRWMWGAGSEGLTIYHRPFSDPRRPTRVAAVFIHLARGPSTT